MKSKKWFSFTDLFCFICFLFNWRSTQVLLINEWKGGVIMGKDWRCWKRGHQYLIQKWDFLESLFSFYYKSKRTVKHYEWRWLMVRRWVAFKRVVKKSLCLEYVGLSRKRFFQIIFISSILPNIQTILNGLCK